MSITAFAPRCSTCDHGISQTGPLCACGSCTSCCACQDQCLCDVCLECLVGLGSSAEDLSIADRGVFRDGLRIAGVAAMLSIGLAFIPQVSFAKNFGTIGQVYPIIEEDFLEMISQGFSQMEEDGRMAAIREEAVARVKTRVERPSGAVLPKAEDFRVFTVDLSITLNRDLADQNGQVFARTGTVVNPLAYSRFNKRIVMIDGDDPEQVDFALAQGNELDTLIVLARGAPLELMRAHGRRFWFDADQQMLRKFGIAALPSIVTRADPLMRIEEIHLKGGR